MPQLTLSHSLTHRAAVFAAVSVVFAAAFAGARPAPRLDEPSFDTVGPIEGEAIAVSGSLSVEVVRGQVKTILRSGSDVRVKSGQARIDLVEGGNIVICGPAHFSVLKSVGSLTLALDFGVVHAHITREPALTIYTAQVQAKPITIGDTPQDTLVGFDATGAMCIRASSGAVRLEQQLTGQNIIVPQGGDVLVTNGQLDAPRAGAGHCSCDQAVAKATPSAPLAPSPEVSMLATTEDIRKKQAQAKSLASHPSPQTTPAREEPIYQVFMPPLAYDPTAKVQQEFDPRLIVMVRRVRVRPTLIYQGRVEGEPVAVASAAPQPNPALPDPHSVQQNVPKPAHPTSDDSMFSRVRSFFRRLWARSS